MALTRKAITQYLAGVFTGVQRTALFGILTRSALDIVDVTTSTYTVPDNNTDMLITLNRAAGIAVLLPAATGSGRRIKFYVGTTFTGNCTIDTIGTDVLQGMAVLNADSTGDVTYTFPTTSSTDTLTMYTDTNNTTGGIVGAMVELQDVAAGVFTVMYVSEAGGTEATPFS